ncbi:hypothetical protein B9Z55_012485 [Caenorhabditis nigoni]|uniref:Homeobox protein cut-like n=2 Tax=Caenorhabditis nigoni TaxID=1611254 RepID=A0A2G5TXG3_9PELO|nr:hypothetical protein B9Z55_012485 [Caenorhabditis nigoni]
MMSEFYNDQHFSNLDCAETVASALFPDLTTTHSNDLPDQYPVTFPPIVTSSSYPSEEYGSKFQASMPPFDDQWNTPNQSSDLTATYRNDLPDQYPVTFPPIVTNRSHPSDGYGSNFQSSSFDFIPYNVDWYFQNSISESPQNEQQFSTSCSSNSSFLAPSPTPSIATSVASEDSMPILDFYPPEGPSMISLWKKLTMPGKNLFIRIFNNLELDDDKKREYLERMDIQEEVKAHMDSSEEIEKQMDDQTASVLNLDARPSKITLNTADLLFRNEENRRNLTYKGMSLSQQMFSTLVLRRPGWHYPELLRRRNPWQSLMQLAKKSYVRIFNWLNLDDDKKSEYLKIMEIEEEVKAHMHSSEEIAKKMDDQAAFIPNLDARPPVGTTMNTIDLIIQNEKNRRIFFYKRRRLTPPTFSTLVLRKSQCLYARLLKRTKSWEALTEKRRKPYVRIYNWLKLDDDKKREYLEIVEIQMKLKQHMDPIEENPKQKKVLPKFSEVETEAEPMEPLVKQQATTASSAPAHSPPSTNIPSPSPASSNTSMINLDASLPNGISINTVDIINACEISRRRFEFNGEMLSKMTFSKLVLERTYNHYARICRNRKPWESLTAMGKALHVRIYNWVQLNDDEKKAYLEMMEKMNNQPVECEEKKTRTKFTKSQQKKKRKRGIQTKFTAYQKKTLKAAFRECSYPTTVNKRSLAKKLNLPFIVIQNYFFESS